MYHKIFARSDYKHTAKYTDLLDMTWLIRGPEDTDIDTVKNHKNWIAFREIETTLGGEFTSLILSALVESNNEDEIDFMKSFKAYMASKLDGTIQESMDTDREETHIYPDQIGAAGSRGSLALDIKKARMSPYIARLAFLYADTDSPFFTWASDLTQATKNGSIVFLDQSPDTRPVTFQVCQ